MPWCAASCLSLAASADPRRHGLSLCLAAPLTSAVPVIAHRQDKSVCFNLANMDTLVLRRDPCSLHELMSHTCRYRLLKMDIEGSEFAVFEDYFERNDTLPFTEILVRGLRTPLAQFLGGFTATLAASA